MAMNESNRLNSGDYSRIERAIVFMEQNHQAQPSLESIARHACVSPFHFQRVFTRWVGISPKRFMQYLTKEYAKQLLEQSRSVLDTSYEAGLSGPGRLHDLFVTCEAVTPGEFKARGDGIEIAYGFHPSPFGEILLGVTERGICELNFVRKGGRKELLDSLRARWRNARLNHAETRTATIAKTVFGPTGHAPRLHLLLKGTNFQIKVWEALLRIPPGAVVAYSDIANALGMPRSARAVGNAVASNPIAYVIPCHRVIRENGDTGNYLGGPARKKAILGWEMARSQM
jgi:AraC family transcriptional regulator of adaptative response/methylated-DNA-[protein]-cysteine methyltransferase